MQTVNKDYVRFLYPSSRQYPVDEICEKIVRKAEEKNWNIPGFELKFGEYGDDYEKYRFLESIRSDDFYLCFGREQEKEKEMPERYENLSAITTIAIPGYVLNLYADWSGPVLFTYAGAKWLKDKDAFLTGAKIHEKMDKKEKSYLIYKGSWNKPGTSQLVPDLAGTLPPYLVNWDDMGRSYAAEGNEPQFYSSEKIFFQVKEWLKEYVLKPIIKAPYPAAREYKPQKENIPWPDKLGPLFAFIYNLDAIRITNAKNLPEGVAPEYLFGLLPYYCYVPINTPDEGTVPLAAYNGYAWCGFYKPGTKTKDLDIAGLPGCLRLDNVIKIYPKSANFIFIVDNWRRKEYLRELIDKKGGELKFYPDEYHEFNRVSARTMIPITEYQGNFKEPVILIGRELSLDEFELIEEGA